MTRTPVRYKRKTSGEDKAAIAVLVVWVFGILVSIGFWGVVLWAIVKVVNHFT